MSKLDDELINIVKELRTEADAHISELADLHVKITEIEHDYIDFKEKSQKENQRLKKAVEYAKKIMISSRAFEDARESFMYNSGIWLEKYGKD